MKEKTKKRLIIVGLAAVCVCLILGIGSVLYREPQHTLPKEQRVKEDVELVVETKEEVKVTEDKPNAEEEKELVIEPETAGSVEEGKQEIQPEPEKTEEKKPKEEPTLSTDTDITDPNVKPSYEGEADQETPPEDNQPSHGDTKDGMMYVEGFGWLPDEGEGAGTSAEDMYENGNKVGIME